MSSSSKTSCSGCGKSIVTLLYMECSKCNELYDLECLNIPMSNFNKFTSDYKTSWMCPTCTCSKPKVGDTSTPIRLLNNTYTNNNVNIARGSRGKQCALIQNDNADDEPSLSLLMDELRLLRRDILDVKSELSSVTLTLSQKFEEFDAKIEAKDQEISYLKAKLTSFESRLGDMEQHNLRNELEIIGVPEQSNENLTHLVLTAAKKVSVDLKESDIDAIHRAGPKRNHSSVGAIDALKFRPIVVKLTRRAIRDKIIFAAKVRRNLTSEGLVDNHISSIYFNERLSNSNRQLFREARRYAKQCNFRFCWVRNGSIYVRKAACSKEKKYPAFTIRSYNDIETYMGKLPPCEPDPNGIPHSSFTSKE